MTNHAPGGRVGAVLITGGPATSAVPSRGRHVTPGHDVVVVDNLTVGREVFTAGCAFYRGDMADGELVDRVFVHHPAIGAVVLRRTDGGARLGGRAAALLP